MSEEYKFNKTYLKSLLNRCYKALDNNSLSTQKKEKIQSDVFFLENALMDRFECDIEYSQDNSKKSFEQVKDEFIIYLKQVYHRLGDKGIEFLLDLYNSHIFGEYVNCDSLDIPDNVIVQTTLKTYENRVPFFFPIAKNILSLNPTSHVLLTRNPEIDSYCRRCDIVDESFVVANTGECTSILAHEIQHGVEDKLHLVTDMSEMGPIFLEMCFEDELYKLEGIKDYSSVVGRISDNGYYLSYLSEFLRLIQTLAIKKFNVSSTDFKKIFKDNVGILDNDVEEFLREENPANEMDFYFDYLFSFLNAIELYINTIGREIPKKMMMSYLKRNVSSIPNESYAFNMYQDYIEDIRRKL